jgi:predicted cupin superfamily sugar epimerase
VSTSPTAEAWIAALGLQPHPEGGHYRETYRAQESLAAAQLPERFGGARDFQASIFFLLQAGERSAFHRLNQDELWFFHAGGPLHIHWLTEERGHETRLLAPSAGPDRAPQAVLPHGVWFGAEPAEGTAFTLLGCSTSPAFDFADFELADPQELARAFPEHRALIERLHGQRA